MAMKSENLQHLEREEKNQGIGKGEGKGEMDSPKVSS
jgi:hypothetical protein